MLAAKTFRTELSYELNLDLKNLYDLVFEPLWLPRVFVVLCELYPLMSFVSKFMPSLVFTDTMANLLLLWWQDVTWDEIVEALITSRETFAKKTSFSQVSMAYSNQELCIMYRFSYWIEVSRKNIGLRSRRNMTPEYP